MSHHDDPDYKEFQAYKKRKAGPNYSGFMVEINTNQCAPIRGPLRDKFEAAVRQILDDMGPIINHRQAGGKYLRDDSKSNLIEDIEVKGLGFEIGKKGRLHVHIPIKITHRSNIRLDKPMLTKMITKLTGLPGCHIDFKGSDASPHNNNWDKQVNYCLKSQNEEQDN